MGLKGKLTGSGSMSGHLSGQGGLGSGLTIPKLVYPGIFQGPYNITPGHEEQVLSTSNLLLTSDITIDRIPEPEMVGQVYDSGEIALEDTTFNGWTPSTTAKAIRSSVTAGTFVADMDAYEYMLKWECSFQAAYNSGATLKAQVFWEGADLYQKIIKRPSSYANIQAGNFNGNSLVTALSVPFMRYYNTSGTLTYAHTISYGIYPAVGSSTFSSSTSDSPTVTIKTPTYNARCSSTYFDTARASELDQANSKFRIVGKLYRSEIPGIIRELYADMYERMLSEQ